MTTLQWAAVEVSTVIGLVPLAVLLIRALAGRATDAAYWWLAFAFAISWLADTAARSADPGMVHMIYPVSQAGLIGAVFLTRRDALLFTAVLVAAAVFAIVVDHDMILRVVAWGGLCGIVVDRWTLGPLRSALLVYFGLGLVAWSCYLIVPGWITYLAYQAIRAAGIGLFCASSFAPVRRLRLA